MRHQTIFCRLILCAVFSVIFCNTDYSAAQQNPVLTVEQTLKQRYISGITISPDLKYAAFSVTEPVSGTTRNSDIWLLDIEAKKVNQFTYSDKPVMNIQWTSDGKIAFLSARYGKTALFTIPVDGGEAQKLFDSETAVNSFELSTDSRLIAFTSRDAETDDEKAKKELKDDAVSQDRDVRNSRLRVYDQRSRSVTTLTGPEWRISEFTWVPRTTKLIVSATDNPKPEFESNRIFIIDAENGEMSELANPDGPFGNIRVSPDGRHIAFAASRTEGPTPFDLYILPISSGSARNITANSIDLSAGQYIWQDGNTITAQFADGFETHFYKISVTGMAQRQHSHSVQPGSFDELGNLLIFAGFTATKAPELFVSVSGGTAEAVSSINSDWDAGSLVEPEIITYPGFEGIEIEAGILKPNGFTPDKTYPAVILVHGGPSGRWMHRFNDWGQLLVSRGFVVLYPNIRGSIGYSHSFMTMNRYDWGGGDYQDIMAGYDYLVSSGMADPERIGIGGWSYGGYMAAWAVTQTDKFKASVSGAPMTDLAVEYGGETPAINAYDTWYLGTPYENLDLFIDRSPMTHVKNVTTPTLILCGENDVIDPIIQCQQFYRGLKRYDVETEFIRYPREGHGIREEQHRIDLLNRIVDWYHKYLMK